jgi:hypothetical protein
VASINAWALHHDVAVYGNDLEEFRLEQCLSNGNVKEMKRPKSQGFIDNFVRLRQWRTAS